MAATQAPPPRLTTASLVAAKRGRTAAVPGTPEAIAAALVGGGHPEEAARVLTQRLDELQAMSGHYEPGTQPGQARAALLVARGHAYWRDLRYMWAHRDFVEAERLHPGGVASASLLALGYCLGLDPEPVVLPGQEELARLFKDVWRLELAGAEAKAKRMHIFHPRMSEPILGCDKQPVWATQGMQILDGACLVEAYDRFPAAEIGYRLIVSRGTPPEETALLVYYHGNGELASEYTSWADLYGSFPCTLLAFDYRAYGWSTGNPEIGCLLRDPAVCIRRLPELLQGHGLPWPWPGPVVLMGRSLGCTVAAGSLILRFPDLFEGLILDSGMASEAKDRQRHLLELCGDDKHEASSTFQVMREFVQESLPPGCEIGQELIAPLSTIEGVRGYRGPVLVLHGIMDFLVPFENARRHYEAAVNARERELVEIPADHNNCAGVPLFWQKQKQFIQGLVQRKREVTLAARPSSPGAGQTCLGSSDLQLYPDID